MNQRLKQGFKTHSYSLNLKPGNKAYNEAIFRHTVSALSEDLGVEGDITTKALLLSSKIVRAKLVAKQRGILAGMEELKFFIGKKTKVKLLTPLKDGTLIRPGSVAGVLEGQAGDILKIERTVLNFLQRMSGVATFAHAYVEKCGKYKVLVCPTRKTALGTFGQKSLRCRRSRNAPFKPERCGFGKRYPP